MQVLNKRKDDIPPEAIYVGRPTKWGNPFVVGVDGNHDQCVELYRTYLLNSPELLNQLTELKGKDLVCWCVPLSCHADVLMDFANRWVNWEVVTRLRKGDWTYHHKEGRPTVLELRTAGIDPKDFRPRVRK